MRKIKFRVWQEDACDADLRMWLWNEIDDLSDMIKRSSKYAMMQYTGFIDENSTEIYEGDIIELDGRRFKVTFESGSFALCTASLDDYIDYDKLEILKQNINQSEDVYWDGTRNDYIVPLWDLYDNFEYDGDNLSCVKVIGNIYENLELIEPIK